MSDLRAQLQAWIDATYPEVKPTGIHRTDYRYGDEPDVDARSDTRDVLEELADEVARILNLTTEWGARTPEGIVVEKTEEFARKRIVSDPEFWTLVNRQTYASEWTRWD